MIVKELITELQKVDENARPELEAGWKEIWRLEAIIAELQEQRPYEGKQEHDEIMREITGH